MFKKRKKTTALPKKNMPREGTGTPWDITFDIQGQPSTDNHMVEWPAQVTAQLSPTVAPFMTALLYRWLICHALHINAAHLARRWLAAFPCQRV